MGSCYSTKHVVDNKVAVCRSSIKENNDQINTSLINVDLAINGNVRTGMNLKDVSFPKEGEENTCFHSPPKSNNNIDRRDIAKEPISTQSTEVLTSITEIRFSRTHISKHPLIKSKHPIALLQLRD